MNDTSAPFSTKLPFPLAGQKNIGKDCLNIGKNPFSSSDQS